MTEDNLLDEDFRFASSLDEEELEDSCFRFLLLELDEDDELPLFRC